MPKVTHIHPGAAEHDLLGLATQAELDAHAALPHGGGAHPDLAGHDLLGLVTEGDLDDHETAPDPHPTYALDADLTGHLAAGDPHAAYELAAEKGLANGYPSLDAGGTIPLGQIPDTIARDSELPDLAGHVAAGDPHPGYASDADLTAHLTDAADAHDASGISYAGGTGIAATDVEGAIDELATEKSDVGHSHGGGAGAWTTTVAVADQTNNTASLIDDTILQLTLVANTDYVIRIRAHYITNATQDLAYRLVFAGTITRLRRFVRRSATSDIAQTIEVKTAFDAADVVLITTGTQGWFEEDILIRVSGTGGILKVQFKQVTAGAGPTTRLEGSYIEVAAA
jgi:hypothetical protein